MSCLRDDAESSSALVLKSRLSFFRERATEDTASAGEKAAALL